MDRAVAALRLGASRAELIVTCGGLGPTEDDLTKEAVALLSMMTWCWIRCRRSGSGRFSHGGG